MTASDEILIRKCCQGDERAWDALLRRYGPLVRAVPRRYGLPSDVCDDICQDVFHSLIESLPALRDARSLSAWLATVTRRQCLRYFEGAAAAITPHGAEPDAEQMPPNIALEEWEERAELMRAMENLAEPCRDLLRAFFLDPTCPDYAAIARRLGRPIGSLGPMRRRCLARLARLLNVSTTPDPASTPNRR